MCASFDLSDTQCTSLLDHAERRYEMDPIELNAARGPEPPNLCILIEITADDILVHSPNAALSLTRTNGGGHVAFWPPLIYCR